MVNKIKLKLLAYLRSSIKTTRRIQVHLEMTWGTKHHQQWMNQASTLKLSKHNNTEIRTRILIVVNRALFQHLKIIQERLRTSRWATKLGHLWKYLTTQKRPSISHSCLQKLGVWKDPHNWRKSTQLSSRNLQSQMSRSEGFMSSLLSTRRDVCSNQESLMQLSWEPYTQRPVSSRFTLDITRGSEMLAWSENQDLMMYLASSIVR